MTKKHTKAARTTQRSVRAAQPGDANVSEDQVARERAQMLLERQSELDGVLDRHDDMVRVLPFCLYDWLGYSDLVWFCDRSVKCSISNSL